MLVVATHVFIRIFCCPVFLSCIFKIESNGLLKFMSLIFSFQLGLAPCVAFAQKERPVTLPVKSLAWDISSQNRFGWLYTNYIDVAISSPTVATSILIRADSLMQFFKSIWKYASPCLRAIKMPAGAKAGEKDTIVG